MVEIDVGFDEISVGVDNNEDRRGGDRWVARLAWQRSVGGEIGSGCGGCGVVVDLRNTLEALNPSNYAFYNSNSQGLLCCTQGLLRLRVSCIR
ncbi:hypothetical protein CMV_028736 [Castanea mollissima]|uniref:Uncharacterized protein n=1 Tax=Castanea mollissima TaxID=60419 RepID=A0A8J4Q4D7_9ROSI|nr:hypothetical protein CMV_028736 [Castanea mollissima]